MKKEFIGKTICMLGDSIMADGYYIYCLRSVFSKSKEKCYVFNRGIGGNRADMADPLLEDEVFSLDPDYCLFSFGCNDMGIWLYDSYKEETEELLKEREERVNKFKAGVENIVARCKKAGVMPIIMSPYAGNQLLIEKPDIPTLGDNKEKAMLIPPWFYKRKTFENINKGLKSMSEWEKELAEKEGVLYLDMFSATFSAMLKEDGMFREDGIHYSEKGHVIIAKEILRFLGCEVPNEFIHDNGNDTVLEFEKRERSVKFLPYNMFNPTLGDFTKEDLIKGAKETAENPENPEWLKLKGVNYLKYLGREEELKKDIIKAVFDYIGK